MDTVKKDNKYKTLMIMSPNTELGGSPGSAYLYILTLFMFACLCLPPLSVYLHLIMSSCTFVLNTQNKLQDLQY